MPHRGSDPNKYMRKYREENASAKEYNAKVGRARSKALTRLAKLFPTHYKRILEEEKLREGLKSQLANETTIEFKLDDD